MKCQELTKGIIKVSNNEYQSLLNRYGIISEDIKNKYSHSLNYELKNDTLFLKDIEFYKEINIEKTTKGYKLSFKANKDERFFGLGDATRDSIMVRGTKALLYTSNIKAYGPQPIILSSEGYALFVNTTYKSIFDICNTDKDMVTIKVSNGDINFYVFKADRLKSLISAITDVTGKPTMLPAFGYGLTIVQNEEIDEYRLLDHIRLIRDRQIPCDTFGLEPGWMDVIYDQSNNKTWSKDRFKLPSWHDENYCGPQSFFYPIREKGMNLSLWLCENYDVFYEEERQLGEKYATKETEEFAADTVDFDTHLNNAIYTDRITKIEEAWFEHLKKFVNQGAYCFKLDGYTQVLEHPDRYWGMKYFDDEIHNLYPVILEKQMKEGFAKHTGRRAMIYSSGSYIGTQKYAATWSGDTGGGPRPLVATLNFAMCGHTNTTCDLDITSPASIHYSFLLTWTQQNVWAYHFYPWNLSKEREDMFRSYSMLRSSLFPYIYKYAHDAYVTGLPIVRPLSLQFEETNKFDNVTNAFMLGDNLLVYAAFDKKQLSTATDYVDSDNYVTDAGNIDMLNISLPKGIWIDYFTEKEYEGDIEYKVLPNKGGALFVKKGSIVITMKPQQYINEKDHDYIINVYPGEDCVGEIYEDDQYTYDYEVGKYASTIVESRQINNGINLIINKRTGNYEGRPNNGHDIVNNSIPEIKGLRPNKDIDVVIHGMSAKVVLNGQNEIKFTTDGNNTYFKVNNSLSSSIIIK